MALAGSELEPEGVRGAAGVGVGASVMTGVGFGAGFGVGLAAGLRVLTAAVGMTPSPTVGFTSADLFVVKRVCRLPSARIT